MSNMFRRATRLLDVGCGCGGSLDYFGQHGGLRSIEGITIGRSQEEYAQGLGLPVAYRHYRVDTGTYGTITAFKCTEHIPYEQLVSFFEWIDHRLEPGGVSS